MKNSNKKSENIEIDDYFMKNYTDAGNYEWKCLNPNKKSNDKDKIEGLVFYGEKKNENEKEKKNEKENEKEMKTNLFL